MKLRVVLALCAGMGASTPAALAENVDFSGVVGNACTITVNSSGTLDTSSDGQTLGTEEGIGSAADIDVVSFGSNTLTVGAPSLISNPAGYDNTNQTLEVRYVGSGGLSTINQAYTSSETTNSIGATASANVVLNARVVNPDGFTTGNYSMRTIVTCAP